MAIQNDQKHSRSLKIEFLILKKLTTRLLIRGHTLSDRCVASYGGFLDRHFLLSTLIEAYRSDVMKSL